LRIQPQTHRGIPRPNQDPITKVMESGSPVLGYRSKTHVWKFENYFQELYNYGS